MWSRVVEVMLGCWLLISPFIFGHPAGNVSWWVTDLGAGMAVIVLALMSYWRPTRYAHLLTLVVATALIGIAYTQAGDDVAPAYQNQAILGLLLLMFALVPNEATRPPDSWELQRRSRARALDESSP